MAEIQKLVIDIDNTKGWDKSGGKSNNVWGQVPVPNEIIKIANRAKSKSKQLSKLLGKDVNYKSCVWTAYDKAIYANNEPITKEDLPSTISATFKSCYNKYSAIVENMAMRIAVALDLPTSYNYIVKFDPNEYPKIIENYPTFSLRNRVDRLGIVSIDFLQSARGNGTVEFYTDIDEDGNRVEVESIYDEEGDKLIPFDDIVTAIVGHNRLSGDQNLIENWVKAVDLFIEKELNYLPREKVNKITHNVHGRIARSFLLKEFCGDCDNTSYNATTVFNKHRGTLVYGPNHDFGDSFNKLLKTKINKNQDMNIEQINALPEAIKKVMLERLAKEEKETVSDIAKQFAVQDSSKTNMEYVLNHFPESAKEFFESIDRCIQTRVFDKIVDSYTTMTCDGKPIITTNEAKIFKEYLSERSAWMSEIYVKYLQSNNQAVPQTITIDEDDYCV